MESSTMNPLVDVIVTYNYTASEDSELSLRPGDVIRGVERLPGGWWRGELRGRVGLFPDSFVRIMGATHDAPSDITFRNSSPRFCRAMYSYQQANPDELSLAVGDVIQVLGEEEEGWWRGQLGHHRGVFPSNFVEPLDTPLAPPPPILPPKPVREQCRVMFPYSAANADELSLNDGDIVTILSREVLDQGWWLGEVRGKRGLFPDNFVTILPPVSSGSDSTNKKPGRPVKNLTTAGKNLPTSMNRKDSSSPKSSIGSGHENVASVRKSLEMNENSLSDQGSHRFKKTDSTDNSADKGTKARKFLEADSNNDQKSKKTLEVDTGKPPVPSKKAGSPVSAIISGIKQKMLAVEQRIGGQQQYVDTADGAASSKASSDPILRSVSPLPAAASIQQPTSAGSGSSPLPAPHIFTTSTETFDLVERSSMLNDPRAGRVKAPRRRPPSQIIRDDGFLTNGSSHQPTIDTTGEEEIIKPKAREWEKQKAPWMAELKLNQAKKTSPIAEIGRSKTISTTDSSTSEKTDVQGRLSGSSDKILESGTAEDEKETVSNSLEMSQSMNALSTNAVKIETIEEVQSQTENPLDMSKSMTSITTRATHLETNNRVSTNELRTSISSSASVVLRSKVIPNNPASRTASAPPSHPIPVVRPLLGQSNTTDSSVISPHYTTSSDKDFISEKSSEPSIVKSIISEKENLESIHSNGDLLEMNGTPEQILIAQLNERVANLEKVVEAQEERFSSALSDLKKLLIKETELRMSLQVEIQKLERCVTRV